MNNTPELQINQNAELMAILNAVSILLAVIPYHSETVPSQSPQEAILLLQNVALDSDIAVVLYLLGDILNRFNLPEGEERDEFIEVCRTRSCVCVCGYSLLALTGVPRSW